VRRVRATLSLSETCNATQEDLFRILVVEMRMSDASTHQACTTEHLPKALELSLGICTADNVVENNSFSES
jgi:hypothetical protein